MNPYTRKQLPDDIIRRTIKLKQILKSKKILLDYNSEIIKERKNNIKQLTVDLFSEIEISGYDCDIKWFLNSIYSSIKKIL